MSELFIYLLKAAIINGVITGFYYFILRDSNRFGFMRATLLSAIILPLSIPLLPFGEVNASGRQMLPAIEITVSNHTVQNIRESSMVLDNFPPIHELVYYIIGIILMTGMIISILSIIKIRISADKFSSKYGEIFSEKTVVNPFSFFKWIFIPKDQITHPNLNMLLKHEYAHVKELHSIDRILSGLIRSILWFSPFSHITGKYLTQIHEYQADAGVLNAEYNKDEYCDLLLSFYFKNQTQRGVTNNFSLHIINRINMIRNSNAGKITTKRIVAGLCITCSIILMTAMVKSGTAGSFNSKVNTGITKVATSIEGVSGFTNNTSDGIQTSHMVIPQKKFTIDTTPPSFPGGDEARVHYISSNLKYPEDAIKNNIEGTVFVQFTVESNGNVTNEHIIRGVSASLDEAALKVIRDMPDWLPAKAGEKAVPFIFTMPLKFKLEKDSKKGLIKTDQPTKLKEQNQNNSSKLDNTIREEELVENQKQIELQRIELEQQKEQMELQVQEMEYQKATMEQQLQQMEQQKQLIEPEEKLKKDK